MKAGRWIFLHFIKHRVVRSPFILWDGVNALDATVTSSSLYLLEEIRKNVDIPLGQSGCLSVFATGEVFELPILAGP